MNFHVFRDDIKDRNPFFFYEKKSEYKKIIKKFNIIIKM